MDHSTVEQRKKRVDIIQCVKDDEPRCNNMGNHLEIDGLSFWSRDQRDFSAHL